MLLRVVLLFIGFAAIIYAFLSCFNRIDRSTYQLVGKSILKLLVAAAFSGALIAACGVISHLSN